MKRKNLLYVLALVVLMAFIACSDDSNPTKTPEFGTVSGRVTFVGAWPATGDVQVSIWTSWPPAGPPASASSAIASGTTVYDYKLEGLNKGEYKALTVGWRDPVNPSGAKVLGLYWANSDSSGVSAAPPFYATPTVININDAKMEWTNINMKADLSFVR
ncbi:hypothetical protein HUU05_11405 [candidate division KSB1 bacterium]|nr:hypothetical protein [candidate division KSB1 bacterium]